ncbi:protein kinase domain-containing protein [Anabaena sp. FACHB-709]|uniref:non-specific serine/threonine protein kinase n=2 Tax=Nostocaceae TaxID=1162 RepID=A0A1Z4KPI4_ANAVA|nr:MULTISPECIES: serine/threonine-protein kinase [Nostocaceae]BAY70876.1 serine/threonine kinase [Trichormus variabilis NIES-23]HBW31010.1 serine/threonine protein kinase [Nostoc sp. UBA8866]MBD2171279.1 serine/threonine protein kinase [Anabaena cylindrica FACHB-318]MBD2263051.1 serine/threonine protein kinase [Anabaena sp. FACHB-709]MBD2272606.1 serine/threonine protein kinase [Nostoc sp. PCC 7120 = FACHB-418]
MSYCLNPRCPKPENPHDVKFCLSCGSKLHLKERYRAIKPIGQGGFGRTFLAVDEDKPSKPRCVIKQFYPQAQGTNTVQKAVELFTQEAVQLDELGKHPQIPELLAYFTQDDRQYLVQEFIDGLNLAQELAHKGVFQETHIIQLLNDLLPVLQFCHNRQVIHRDIKPENIILRNSDNKLVVVDFGASKSATNTALNHTGTSIGSPEYVAPEQMRGRAIFASDIYSLGVTCINLLTGRSPFDSYDTNNDTWIWQQYLKPPVSNHLHKIINKMTASVPARRYQNVEEVLKDLNQYSPVVNTPAKSSHQPPQIPSPQPVSKSQSQIDLELEELKTQFLPGGKSKPQNIQPQPATNNNAAKSEIDLELEELKAKYLGNNNA